MKKISLYIAFTIITSCTTSNLNDQLFNEVMVSAGENRSELEKVLNHYKEDSLKIRATRFLIENMFGKYSIVESSIKEKEPYYDALESYLNEHGSYGVQGVYIACDKVEKKQISGKHTYTPDATTISGDFLIKQIDHAFEAWNMYPWSSEVDFETFCRYILPYKAGNSYWDGTNAYFKNKYGWMTDKNLSLKEAFNCISTNIDTTFVQEWLFYLNDYGFLLPTTFKNVVRTQLGQCLEYNYYKITALRSMGIPATLIKIPGWANYGHQHFWTETIGLDTIRTLYNNNTKAQYHTSDDEIISCMFWTRKYISPDKGIPDFLPIQSSRTVPKVYQETFEVQESSLALQATEDIPSYFMNAGLKDVTKEYIKTTDIQIKLNSNPHKKQYVYLCCYDVGSWNPVDWSIVKNRTGSFKHIGMNILYLPAYYINKKIVPAGNPFILTEEGEIRELYNDDTYTIGEATLYSKTPYKTITIHQASTMLNSQFQVANHSDLSDTVTIHSIDETPYYVKHINVSLEKPVRYGIYRFPELNKYTLSEYDTWGVGDIEFWGEDENGNEVLLQGEFIGNTGTLANPVKNAFDDDRVSYFFYNPDEKERYIGIDFGTPQKLTRITFYPRNDDNRIVPGELYELYYWNKGNWASLGQQAGKENSSLVYTRIPDQTLLRLHNHTRGKEHRPFTYENNKQNWW